MRSALLAAVLLVVAVAPSLADSPTMPILAPSPDETAIDSTGNARTDALLDCYDKFKNPDGKGIGPPHLAQRADGSFVLRADFPRAAGAAPGVDRLVCWNGGFITQKNLDVAPLDPGGQPDAATQRAIDDRAARARTQAHSRATAPQLPPPDAQTARQLEGAWLIGAKPDKGSCVEHLYDETQIEFDFAKSGGRALVFEAGPFLFSAIQIAGASRTGDVISLQRRLRDGGLDRAFKLKILDADRIQLLPIDGPGEGPIAYRCAAPDRSVTAGVAPERLAALSPPLTGGWVYIASVPGISNADLCQGKGLSDKQRFDIGSIQFELYGPVHYWVFGMYVKIDGRHIEFDFLRAVVSAAPNILKLKMQQRLTGSGGWDVAAGRGPTYDLTVIDHGDSIEIPELKTSFARCSAAVSAGMARW